MSPDSQQRRKKHTRVERGNDKLKLAKYKATELDLDEEQHDDMCRTAETIKRAHRDKLDRLIAEGDAHGVEGVLKNVWEMDYRKHKDQFLYDRTTNSKCCFVHQ